MLSVLSANLYFVKKYKKGKISLLSKYIYVKRDLGFITLKNKAKVGLIFIDAIGTTGYFHKSHAQNRPGVHIICRKTQFMKTKAIL